MRFTFLLLWVLFGALVAGQTAQVDSLRHVIDEAGTQEQRREAIRNYLLASQRMGIRDSMDYWAGKLVEQGRAAKDYRHMALGFASLLNHDFVTEEKRIPELADSALHYFNLIDDQKRIMGVRTLYGFWLNEQFQCELGLRQMELADSLANTLDLPDIDKTKRRLSYLMSLTSCRQYQLVPPLIPEAAALARRLSTPDKLSTIYSLACNAYLKMQMPDSAAVYLRRMEELLPNLVKKDNQASYYGQASRLELARGEFKRSLNNMELALKILQDNNITSPYTVAPKQAIAGRAAYQLGLLRKSMDYYKSAQPYIESTNQTNDIAELYSYMGDTYAALGDLGQASFYHREGRFMEDSLAAAQHQIRIERLTTEFETERVKRELVVTELARVKAESKANRYQLIGLSSIIVLLVGIGAWLLLNARRRRKQLENDKKQAELKYALLRARMNPHFIFNSLNSIQSFFSNQRFSIGNDYLSTFSNLIRRILDQTTQTSISLQEELETLEMYLQLEKLRLGDNLDYFLHVDPALEIDLMEVPPLVLQPFVENAIWHGVAPKNAPGRIDIHIIYVEATDAIRAIIEDDGVGLGHKAAANGHQSQGIQITRNRLGRGGKVTVNDREDFPGISGVRTELIIPLREENLLV